MTFETWAYSTTLYNVLNDTFQALIAFFVPISFKAPHYRPLPTATRVLGAVLLTVGRSYVGIDARHSTLLDMASACSYENLPKYRSYRVSSTAPLAPCYSQTSWQQTYHFVTISTTEIAAKKTDSVVSGVSPTVSEVGSRGGESWSETEQQARQKADRQAGRPSAASRHPCVPEAA